jgi:DNA-binding NtrC family response regulator
MLVILAGTFSFLSEAGFSTPFCTHVPVIMVTADEDPEMRLEAVGAGATEFMMKPVNHQECRKLCRKLLVQYQQ